MKTFRKIMLALIVVNLSVLGIQAAITFFTQVNLAVNPNPSDDWAFKVQSPLDLPEPPNPLQMGLLYLSAFWFTVECFRLLSFSGRLVEFAAVGMVILVLVSVSGPMIGSITDQGRASMERNIGFAVGGAKDIENFRENIKRNYLPIPTDITYEGLFYDYYFDTGNTAAIETHSSNRERLFYPSYSCAIARNPISSETEYFLSVGLNSDIRDSDFARKKLNLVVVLDVSGSMGSSFNRYYYDQFRKKTGKSEAEEEDFKKNKLEVACQSICDMIDHLKPDDRFGMVIFDHAAYVAKPIRLVSATDIPSIKKHIMELEPMGGTNMEEGLELGTSLIYPYRSADKNEHENRVIFLTDAMPNTDDTSEEGLLSITRKNSNAGIFFTFMGIGLDFNTELVEAITKIRGANYFSIHSPGEFNQRLAKDFEYMVTPLVFNLTLNLDAKGYTIDEVYGSPEANQATGEIMKVNTLFPSKKVDSGTRGGLVLLKLRKSSHQASIRLRAGYETRTGKIESEEAEVVFPDSKPDYFQNSGIRKGILLARYVKILKDWLETESGNSWAGRQGGKTGTSLNYWERQSQPLQVAKSTKKLLSDFQDYFEKEMAAVSDNSLKREIEVLDKLRQFKGSYDS